MIERAFDKIFKSWFEMIEEKFNFSLQPLKFVSAETNTDALIKLYEKDMIPLNDVLNSVGFPEKETGNKYLSDSISTPLAVRLGVGGTQALQSILSDANMTKEQKVASMEELFGLNHENAVKLVFGKFNN
jgi:hypothetical protein